MTEHGAQVVVGVDGSEGSLEALRWAAHEAARRDWPLHVVTCAQLPVAVGGMVGDGVFAGSSLDAIVKEQEAINQRAVDNEVKKMDAGGKRALAERLLAEVAAADAAGAGAGAVRTG